MGVFDVLEDFLLDRFASDTTLFFFGGGVFGFFLVERERETGWRAIRYEKKERDGFVLKRPILLHTPALSYTRVGAESKKIP